MALYRYHRSRHVSVVIEAFTLIEVLIAIAVIAVLVAITTVVAGSAIKRSKVTACSENLRAIGRAMVLYAGDHDDQLPPYCTFAGGFAKGPTVPAQTRELVTAYKPYGINEASWRCPLDHIPEPLRVGTHQGWEISSYETPAFDLFKVLQQVGTSWKFQLNKVDEPSKVAYLRDAAFEPSARKFQSAHGGWHNRLYFDGHVKSQPENDGL